MWAMPTSHYITTGHGHGNLNVFIYLGTFDIHQVANDLVIKIVNVCCIFGSGVSREPYKSLGPFISALFTIYMSKILQADL